MDSIASWAIVLTLVVTALYYLIKALPSTETHAYDEYNKKIEKNSWW